MSNMYRQFNQNRIVRVVIDPRAGFAAGNEGMRD
jgi:hypothetical protein